MRLTIHKINRPMRLSLLCMCVQFFEWRNKRLRSLHEGLTQNNLRYVKQSIYTFWKINAAEDVIYSMIYC